MIKKNIVEYRTDKFESAVVRNDSGLYSVELPDSFGKEKLKFLAELLAEVIADSGDSFQLPGKLVVEHTPGVSTPRAAKPPLLA